MIETPSEAATCEHCGDTGWKLVKEGEREFVRRCSCAVTRRREALFERAGIPDRYRHCTFDGIEIWDPSDGSLRTAVRKVREFVDLWPEVERGFVLMGPVGTGKTHLAVAALSELIRGKGVAGRFQDFTSLTLDIKMTFDTPGAQRDLVRPLIRADLLVLDELGAGKVTPWVMDLLYYVVNSRYVQDRRTIFTTNFLDAKYLGGEKSLEESLETRVSARIRSRLFEMCEALILNGQDYRKHCAERRSGRW